MGKIFHHNNGDEFDLRLDEISKYVLLYFQRKIEPSNTVIRKLLPFVKSRNFSPKVYILDSHLEPFDGLFSQIQKNEYDSFPLIKILMDMYNVNPNTEYKVITSRDLSTLKGQLHKDDFRGNYAKFFLNSTSGKIEVLSYSSKKGPLPRKLHDRWFILKVDNEFLGLHFGPSINHYEYKDFTISEFDKETAIAAGKRFEEIWNASVGR